MIEPGIGTKNIKLGCFIDDISSFVSLATDVEDRGQFKIYKTPSIWFFFNKSTDKLDQLSLFVGFNEKVLDRVGLGDDFDKLIGELGSCRVIDGVIEPENFDGIAFELNGDKCIDCISVSIPYQFYSELSDHIRRNMKKGRKKLP